MKQEGACSFYVTKFNHYALLTQFDKLALKEFFYDGLKEGVKDLLLMLSKVTTLYMYCRSGDCTSVASMQPGYAYCQT
jgi:hypothetical protein